MTPAGDVAFDLAGYLEARRARIDAALERALGRLLARAPDALARPVRYAVQGGGKRLRPVLCLGAYEAAGGTASPAADELAAALELVHAYSLAHDDLPCMDDDDVRRGRPTTHRAYDVGRATLAGAALVPLAFRLAAGAARGLGLPDRVVTAVGLELAAGAGGGGMVGGQLLDLLAEGAAVPLDALEAIHGRKTGALIAAAVRIGGLAAGAAPLVLDALGVYGRSLGLAFQMADDVLDVSGDPALTGKSGGRDRALAKATYPAELGVDGTRARAREQAEAAVAALDAADVRSPALRALAEYVVERHH